MKFTTLSRRTAAAGAASALVAGALVGATTTVAQAAPVQNIYTCTTPVGPTDVVLDTDAPGIEGFDGVLPAGFAAPADQLSVNNTFTVSDSFHQTLVDFGVEDLAFPDFAGSVGNSTVPVSGVTAKVSEMTQNDDTTWSVDATQGLNDAFETPRAGTFPVLTPASFTITTTIGGSPVNVPCDVQGEPGSYADLSFFKNESESTAKAVNSPVMKGSVAKVKVKVTAPNETPSGKVVLKKGKKTVAKGNLNNKGVVVLKTKSLPVGKNKLKTVYKGDGYTNKSKAAVVVKVRR